MEIIEDKENFLLNRREVKVIVEAEKNPGFEEAENMISEQFKVEKENIIVKGIKGKFGRNTFLITAFIYKSKEDKEKIERKKKEKAGTQPAQEIQQTAQPTAITTQPSQTQEQTPQTQPKAEEKK